MKKTIRLLGAVSALALVAALPTLSGMSTAKAAEDGPKLQSLRGADVSVPDTEGDLFKREKDREPIPRDYVQQPPLIPHTIQGYTITKNFNKCMDCHAWSRYKEYGATKVSLTHFKTRDGQELSNISPRRYFCLQCHVSQTDAKPLVKNTFKRAEGLQ